MPEIVMCSPFKPTDEEYGQRHSLLYVAFMGQLEGLTSCKYYREMGAEVLIVLNIKTIVVWDVMPCSLVHTVFTNVWEEFAVSKLGLSGLA
jgi:hypothetical protein